MLRAKSLILLTAMILPQGRPQLFQLKKHIFTLFIQQLDAKHDANTTLRPVENPRSLFRGHLEKILFKIKDPDPICLNSNPRVRSKTHRASFGVSRKNDVG